jgi:hypothetical protein
LKADQHYGARSVAFAIADVGLTLKNGQRMGQADLPPTSHEASSGARSPLAVLYNRVDLFAELSLRLRDLFQRGFIQVLSEYWHRILDPVDLELKQVIYLGWGERFLRHVSSMFLENADSFFFLTGDITPNSRVCQLQNGNIGRQLDKSPSAINLSAS